MRSRWRPNSTPNQATMRGNNARAWWRGRRSWHRLSRRPSRWNTPSTIPAPATFTVCAKRRVKHDIMPTTANSTSAAAAPPPPTAPIRANSALAKRFAPRLIALAERCPEGKLVKAAAGQQRAECKRRGGISELNFKLMLRDDTMGDLMLNATVTIAAEADGMTVSLMHGNARRSTEFFTQRQEKFLSATLSWAEHALPAATPEAPSRKAATWQKDCVALYTLLSGRSPATARKRLNEGFFADVGEAGMSQRTDALLERLRDDNHLAQFDWKEDERLAGIEAIEKKRGVTMSPERNAGDDTSAAARFATVRQLLDQQGFCLIAIESGMDADLFAVAARQDLEALAALLLPADRALSVDVYPLLEDEA